MTTVTKLGRWIGFVIALAIIVAALLVSVGRLLTPYMNDHLPDFEAWSTRILQVPVKIGRVHISWNIYEPEIAFDQVKILDKATQKAKFSVAQIKVNFNIFRSLLAWHPMIQTIKVSGAHLTIRQPTTDKILVDELKDIAISDTQMGESSHMEEALAWIFSQPNLMLENFDLTYYLPSGTKKSITIEHLVLQNDATQHKLSGAALLNQEVPTHVNVLLQWQGDVADFQHVSGEAYLYLESVSLPQWLSHFSWHHLQLKQGIGSAKIWLAWKNNQFEKIQSQFQFYDVAWESELTHKLQQMQRVSGHVGWRIEGTQQIFAGDDILLDFPEHLWPTTSFTVVTEPDKQGVLQVKQIHLGYLDLNDAKNIMFANDLVSDALKKNLTALNLKGEVREFNLSLPLLPTADYMQAQLSTQFSQLSFNPWQAYPGITNAHGVFAWDGQQGRLTLDSQHSGFTYPAMFSKPLQFEQLAGHLVWQKAKEGAWSATLKNFQLLNQILKQFVKMHSTHEKPSY